MMVSIKLKTYYKIGNESGYERQLGQPTEVGSLHSIKFHELISKARKAGNWLKEDIKESYKMLKEFVTDPKEAGKSLGRDVAELLAIAKLNLSPINREQLKPQPEPAPIIEQRFPNPLKVYPNGKVQNLGQRTHLMAVEQTIKGRFYKDDNGDFWYEGRKLIGQNAPNTKEGVDKGVYTGSSTDSEGNFIRESIVVDFDKDPIVSSFYQKLVDKVMLSNDKSFANIVRIYDRLITPMIGLEKSELLAQKYKGQKVQLGMFMQENGVVCRHSAVLFAMMFQKLKEQSLISGSYTCSINRHFGTWKGGADGMHVYCKVDMGNGYYIVDPIQQSSGPLEVVARTNPYAAEGDLKYEIGQKVKILRNSGKVEIWAIKSVLKDPINHENDLITVYSSDGLLEKSVLRKDLEVWQDTLNVSSAQSNNPRNYARIFA
jgi:hypothetical protein